ncbi:YqjK family protein [Ideonella sp. YS5]|uniref:YqjK family protein n=1 Tax=Ideonella sp. YS5 TaxID=3453714 RepID=UPI003EEEA2CC
MSAAAQRARVLAARRHALVARSAQQRRSLHNDAARLRLALSPAAWLARGAAGVRRHPAWLLAGIAGLFALRRLGTRRWLGHALTAWQLWQTMQRWWPADRAGAGSRAP